MQQQINRIFTQIPEDVARLAHEQQLGTPQASYTIFKLFHGWRWTAFVLPVLLCCDLLFGIIALMNISHISDTINWVIAFLLLILPIYILLLLIIASNRLIFFYSCDKGFISQQAGKNFRVVRWDEIETIQSTMAYTPTSFFTRHRFYTIHCHDGYTLTFSGKRKTLTNLNKTLEEQLRHHLLPCQFSDYQAGQTLTFGPLSVNRTGIAVHDKVLLWEQVADISLLKDRRLVIYKVGEQPEIWLNLPAFKVPNLSILLALFKRIRSGQSEQEAVFADLATSETTTAIVSSRRKIDPLPEGLAALAEEQRLGERRVDQNLGRKRIIGWPLPFFLVIFEAFFVGYILFVLNISSSYPYTPDWTVTILPLVTKVFLLAFTGLFSLIILLSQLQHFPHATYTFERGLIFQNGQQTPVICRWDEIESIQNTSTLGKSMAYLVGASDTSLFQLRDGSKLPISAYDINYQALTSLIKEQIVPLQLPATVAAYQNDQTLSFGQVRVNQQGIALDNRQLPWSQVKSVGLETRHLVIYDITQRQPWCKLLTTRVSNLYLLFALADYARDDSALTHR